MEIFHNINGLTYILALGFLGMWFLLSSHRKWNVIMGMAFLLSLMANFLVTMGLTIGPVKYFIFSKNLILISFFGFVFRILRKNKIGLILAIMAGIIISLQLFKINFVQRMVPQKVKESIEHGELLIETSPQNIVAIQSVLRNYKGRIDKAFHPKKTGTALDQFYLIDIPDDIAHKKDELLLSLSRKGLIQYGEYNDVVQVNPIMGEIKETPRSFLAVNDPLVPEQWAVSVLNFDEWYKIIIDHQNQIVNTVKIAVLDTGVDGNHEDLIQLLDKNNRGNDDPIGHGTHCAGIIAAETNNKTGIASMAFYNNLIRIMPIKVLNRMGFGTQAQIIKGMIAAVDDGAEVLSMSLGGISDTPKQKAYLAAVQYARDHNAVVVTSAGNSSSSARGFSPANVPGVICVTALNEQSELAEFSNHIEEIEWGIAAPGVNILSTYSGNQYKSLSGTSMAAPFVSSAVGVIKAFAPELTPEEIFQILHNASLATDDVQKSGGIIQPAEALKVVLSRLN